MENRDEANINMIINDINTNPHESIHTSTPINLPNQSHPNIFSSPGQNSAAEKHITKILKGNHIIKTPSAKKTSLQLIVSPQQKRIDGFNLSVKHPIIINSSTKSLPLSLHNESSQLRISGQKVVDESISLIRPMKYGDYDTTDVISPTIASHQKPSLQLNASATKTMISRKQLQEQRTQKIRMQQNMIVNCKNPGRFVTQEDMKQLKKRIECLERKQKIAEEAKNKEKPEINNPYFVNLLPTAIL